VDRISQNRPVAFNDPQIPAISPGFEPGGLREELIVSSFFPHLFKFYYTYVLDSLSEVTLKGRLTQDVGKTRQNFLATVKTDCS
jgi:hypothetical protein